MGSVIASDSYDKSGSFCASWCNGNLVWYRALKSISKLRSFYLSKSKFICSVCQNFLTEVCVALFCCSSEFKLLFLILIRAAINETLTAEVQRLKFATSEIAESELSKSVDRQQTINAQIFPPHQLQLQLQNQVSAHIPTLYHFQSQQRSSAGRESESKKR